MQTELGDVRSSSFFRFLGCSLAVAGESCPLCRCFGLGEVAGKVSFVAGVSPDLERVSWRLRHWAESIERTVSERIEFHLLVAFLRRRTASPQTLNGGLGLAWVSSIS